MAIGIVVFPGSNCDRDVFWATQACLDIPTRFLWHESTDLNDLDAIVIPGGFSYGDYLRCGAIARFAPILSSVIDFVNKGGKVLGICNGFQILTEMGLLPGVLTRNRKLHFICDTVPLIVSSCRTDWFKGFELGAEFTLPIAHGEGCFQCSKDVLKKLEDENSIAVRYKNNPNGSVGDIAGITNKKGNVLGMMPHPERACDDVVGGIDGRRIIQSLIAK